MSAEAFLASLLGRECFVGIDMADKIDLASVVCIFPRPLTSSEPVARAATDAGPDVDVAGPDTDRPTINCAIDVLPFFWMPAKTLARRAQEDKIQYPDWVEDGHVRSTPGSLIDHDAIVAFIIGVPAGDGAAAILGLADLFRIRGIGIDQAGAAAVVSKLKRHFGDELVQEVPQGVARLSEPTKLLEALVVSDNLVHDANPCMAWCLANMAIDDTDAWGRIRPVKILQRKRIDGGVALIDALERMGATTPKPPAKDPALVTA